MTKAVIKTLAEKALARIAEYPKNYVPAARRGIVAGAEFPQEATYLFRRVAGSIRFEIWRKGAITRIEHNHIPLDLARRAGEMLDAL